MIWYYTHRVLSSTLKTRSRCMVEEAGLIVVKAHHIGIGFLLWFHIGFGYFKSGSETDYIELSSVNTKEGYPIVYLSRSLIMAASSSSLSPAHQQTVLNIRAILTDRYLCPSVSRCYRINEHANGTQSEPTQARKENSAVLAKAQNIVKLYRRKCAIIMIW